MKRAEFLEQMEAAKIKFNEKDEFIFNLSSFERFRLENDGVLKFVKDKSDESKIGVFNEDETKFNSKTLLGTLRVEKQVHNATGKDIRFWSGKVGQYGIKALTHQGKKGVEYRCFISYKDEAGKLRRYRINNSTTKKLSNKKDEFLKYVQSLTEKDISKELSA